MADTTYQTNVYHEQAGDRLVVASGGSADVESGGEIDIESGGALKIAGTAVTSTAAELNILDGVTSTAAELNILDGVTSTAAELNILDGVTSTAAELNILDGVTSTAAELNILDGVTATAAEINHLDNADKLEKCIKVALVASDAAAGLFTWQNTEESAAVIVTKLVLDITTASTGACTGDFGEASTAILSDDLIDGADLNAAVAVFDSVTEAGTAGKGAVKVADDEFVTGSVASGASSGIVGSAYIFYFVA